MSVQEVSFAWYKGAAQNEPSHLQGSKSQTGLSPCQNCLTTVVQKNNYALFQNDKIDKNSLCKTNWVHVSCLIQLFIHMDMKDLTISVES